ncbi:MAG: molybdenum cofactor guanylyltransferase [Eubacterium sp.]|nr:molybdenum cofactor guanylyltransferase [Eubacterium sp.]
MNNSKYRIAAAVLAGGRSKRMGSPKESMIITGDGRTFLDKICDEVDECFGKCIDLRILSLREGQTVFRDGYMPVYDRYDDIGPLGGLISILEKAVSEGIDACLIIACDMINYTAEEIRRICEEYKGEDILFARTDYDKRIQPLASIYSVKMLQYAVKMAEEGDYRMRKLADMTENVGYYNSRNTELYANINYPANNNGQPVLRK